MWTSIQDEAVVPSRRRVVRTSEIGALRARAEALDPRQCLALPLPVVERELVGPLRDLAAEAATAFGALASGAADGDELGDTAFAAKLDATHGSRLLAGELDRAAALIACDMVRQGLLRSTRAVLGAARGQLPSQFDDGRAAACVRALYMRLSRSLGSDDATSTEALARMGRALRETTERPEFAQVRLSDRFVIESVRARFDDLVRKAAPSEEDVSQLVSDARSMVELLSSINRRPELCDHDRRLTELALGRLSMGALPRALLLQIRELLRGRDELLDLELDRAARHLTRPPQLHSDLREALKHVRASLD